MGITSVTSAPNGAPPPGTNPNQIKQAFSQLTSALQSGDMASAQSAYQTIMQSPMASNPNSPIAKDLSQIGSALQSGDVGSAQQAMADLQQKMQTMRAHHHHHAQDSDPSQSTDQTAATDASASTTTASTSSTSTLVDVTA